MSLKAKQQGVTFADYDDGRFRNIYNLLHEVNGKDVCFGQIEDTGEGRTFYIDDADAAFSGSRPYLSPQSPALRNSIALGCAAASEHFLSEEWGIR